MVMKLARLIAAALISSGLLSSMGTVFGADATNSETAYLADLFSGRVVLRIQIEIPPSGIQELSDGDGNRGRPSTLATVKEGGHVYTNVEVHLKGGAGSNRPLEDNPGLTLNFEKSAQGQRFHGLKKFMLNNSVQDSTYLNEKICRELFNAAGSPTARAGFAAVQLNGRELGIHVLVEGYNKQFLKQHFEDVRGNLYQTHGNQEITARLDVNSGDDPKNNTGLHALAEAVKEPDPTVRWNRLQQTLDVNRFLTFMALEMMLCHWDGYCMNQNNWRAFHDLRANKIVFIAHGMDQMFGRGHDGGRRGSDFPLYPPMHGAVAKAVMNTPEGRKLYTVRVGELYTNLFRVDVILKRVDELAAVIGSAMNELGLPEAGNYQRKVQALKTRIERRGQSLAEQLGDGSKPPEAGLARPLQLTSWTTRVYTGQPVFDKSTEGSRSNLLHISTGNGKCSGSWRSSKLLEPGKYRFEGELRVEGVNSGIKDAGAGLRISGRRPIPEISGTSEWKVFTYEFQLEEETQVEFVCELRAVEGQAWFNTEKLLVVRVE
jgi:spore coat protein H